MSGKLELMPEIEERAVLIVQGARDSMRRSLLYLVADSQATECALKYVMHISGGPVWTSVEHTYTEQWNYAGMISICGVFLNIRN